MWLIWDLRNKLRFKEKVSIVSSACRTIINHVYAPSTLVKGHMSNKVRDLCTIHSFGVRCRPSPNPKILRLRGIPLALVRSKLILMALAKVTLVKQVVVVYFEITMVVHLGHFAPI